MTLLHREKKTVSRKSTVSVGTIFKREPDRAAFAESFIFAFI